jgi:glucokinase
MDCIVSRHLGLDVGGTNVKWAVVDEEGTLIGAGSSATAGDEGPEAVMDRLARLARHVAQEAGGVDTVGVGLPGLYDAARGTARFLPNLAGDWSGVRVAGPVAAAAGAPAALINDVRAFTLAEHRVGAGRGCSNMVGLALGTGVGGGIIVDGRLHSGLDGTAGEIGHQTVIPDGPPCTCGNRGCVEPLANAAALARAGGRSSADEVVAAARGDDEVALQALEQVGRYLGIAVANVIVVLSPERVVVGGGVAGAGDMLLDPLRAEVRRRVFVTPLDRIAILPAALGPVAGAIGAALWGAEAA